MRLESQRETAWHYHWQARSRWSRARREGRDAASPCSSARPARPSTSPGERTRSQRSEMNRPETIEETAALVDEAGGRGIAVQVDHLVPDEVRALVAAHRTRAGRAAHPRQRHLGRHRDGVGQDGVGVVAGRRPAHAAPGRRHPRHHQPLRAAAADQDAGRARGRGDRRHRRVQRDQLPGLVLLRPRQGGGEPHGVRAGARAGAPRRDGGVAHAGLAALRGDARGLSASPRRTGATRPSVSPTSPSPRARRSSAGPWRRWPPIPTCRAGTGSRCRAGSWRRSTASPTSTAASPTRGATSSRCRTPGKPADITGYR